MKNFKKFTAFVLALCMLFSLSVAAFAAEPETHTVYDSAPDEDVAASAETATSGTIPGSKIKWELNEHNWLMISGSGDCEPFTSKDDQPWAAVRDQITQVWFDDMENLRISDLAYWFEDCVNLTTAEIPGTTPTIGKHAFYNCPKLSTLTIYYGERTSWNSIGEDAFWRESDGGDTLYIGYLIGYPKSVPFSPYDWAASNRSERYFYDLYGVYQNADAGSAATSGIKKAPGISVQSTGSIIGNCPSCGKYSFQGTYVEVAHSSRGHANYNECYLCHYVQYFGTYTYQEPRRWWLWFGYLPGLRQPYMGAAKSAGVHLYQQRLQKLFVRLRSDQKRNDLFKRAQLQLWLVGAVFVQSSTGVKITAGTAAQRTTTTLRTA